MQQRKAEKYKFRAKDGMGLAAPKRLEGCLEIFVVSERRKKQFSVGAKTFFSSSPSASGIE